MTHEKQRIDLWLNMFFYKRGRAEEEEKEVKEEKEREGEKGKDLLCRKVNKFGNKFHKKRNFLKNK